MTNTHTHTHVSIVFQILFPFKLLHGIEQSSLCYAVGPCWLFILNIAVYTCRSQTSNCPSLIGVFLCHLYNFKKSLIKQKQKLNLLNGYFSC